MNEQPRRVRPRRNVATGRKLSFRKRYEAVGYWIFLAAVLTLVIWFLSSSAVNRGAAGDGDCDAICAGDIDCRGWADAGGFGAVGASGSWWLRAFVIARSWTTWQSLLRRDYSGI